jgi:uracil phosphoribosyltransferase
MKIINLSEKNSLLNQFLYEIRHIEIQRDRMRFRRNVERIGEIMAYEISQYFQYSDTSLRTSLGEMVMPLPSEQVVISTILRAGLPFHQGFLNYFDQAENAFIAAFRTYQDETRFDIQVSYLASPSLDGKTLLLTDPMLATGRSLELVYQTLLSKGKPTHIHLASVIASRQGIEYVKTCFPAETIVWCAAIDPDLNEQAYIVPGLGDAGDLAYGEKI